MLKRGITAWKDTLKKQDTEASGATRIVERLKKKLLRKGFQRYREGVEAFRLAERNSDGADHLLKTITQRKLHRCISAWRLYSHKFKKAKCYWEIVLTKFNTWQLKWAFNKWNEGKNQNKIEDITMKMEEITDYSNQLSAEDKDLALTLERDIKRKREADQCVRKQKQMNVSTHLQRRFFTNIRTAFTRWKGLIDFEDHRHALMRDVLKKWKLRHARFLFHTFKNNMAWKRHNDERDRIAQLSQNIIDQGLVINGEENDHTNDSTELVKETMVTQQQADRYERLNQDIIEKLSQ